MDNLIRISAPSRDAMRLLFGLARAGAMGDRATLQAINNIAMYHETSWSQEDRAKAKKASEEDKSIPNSIGKEA